MNLTPHFSLSELTASQEATRNHIDNTPAPAIVSNLKRLAGLLEAVRALVDAPITISSGYRSPALNELVGGAANSAHMLGLAADIHTEKLSPGELAGMISESGIVFDQLIDEGRWVHIALSIGVLRRQVLRARFGASGISFVAANIGLEAPVGR